MYTNLQLSRQLLPSQTSLQLLQIQSFRPSIQVYSYYHSFSYTVPFYDINTARNPRTTTLGYGNRDALFRSSMFIDYVFLDASPGPGTYALPSAFKSDPNKGFQFGLCREAYAKTYLESNPPVSKDGPGPGSYQLPKVIGRSGPGYSLRQRTADTGALANGKNVPGPGHYPVPSTIHPIGKIFQSKFKSSGATVFNPTNGASFGRRCIFS